MSQLLLPAIFTSNMFWNTNVCRICSQNTETMYPIFDKLTNRNIDQKIKQCLKLNVNL